MNEKERDGEIKEERGVPQGTSETSYNFIGREEKAACDQKLSSSIPPGASLHHHLSHHASPDRTLQMHYGIWGRRARGCRVSWIFDKTWDDQTEVVRRRGGSSILHHSTTWILHAGNSLSLLIFFIFFVSGKFREVWPKQKSFTERRVYPQSTSHCCFILLVGSEKHRRRVLFAPGSGEI